MKAKLLRRLLTGATQGSAVEDEDLHGRFGRIARGIDPADLQRGDGSVPLTQADILHDLVEHSSATRILDYYSTDGVEYAFERYGILRKLRDRGFSDLRFNADPSDAKKQIVRIHGWKDGARHLLMELILCRRVLSRMVGVERDLELLSVEWLLLQDPTSAFTAQHPPLPGQEHPGLGIAHDIDELLVQACLRLGLDGIVSRPSHYHNAEVASRNSRFLDPGAEGRLLAIRKVLAGHALPEASALVERGGLCLRDGSAFEWTAADQVLAVRPQLQAYFLSPAYREARDAACRELLGAGLHLGVPED